MQPSDTRRATVGLDEGAGSLQIKAAVEASKVDEVADMFARFDLDGSGTIERQELEEVLGKLDKNLWSKENIDKLWRVLDENGDGVVDYEEFGEWLVKTKKPQKFSIEHEFTGSELADMALYSETKKDEEVGILEDADVDQALADATDYFASGQNAEGQKFCDVRPMAVLGDRAFPGTLPLIACHKGSKGAGDNSPNQDNYSITCLKGGYTLICVFDGHGKDGHETSVRTVRTVPYFFIKSRHFPNNIEEALKEAFVNSHNEMVNYAYDNGIDIEGSGSTAVAAVWKDSSMWFAWAGDSRAIMGSRGSKPDVIKETLDHKPDAPKEKARIEASGGEVRSETYPDGWVNHRIYCAGKSYPGLCMARTLGDNCAKSAGVTAEPEVVQFDMQLGERPFLVLASDGIWEFIDTRKVVKHFGKDLDKHGSEKMMQKLVKDARKKWKENEGDYCDDITAILVTFD
eukprot:TRINITY_DN20849_c0_g1_i1.p1 TRINITY_DN20849_c0_g1~~TRINITY_DN20849_c0_g1_i1.p1  ORF type:complete len:459 (-),score=88.94 TRINITY_DN20849_c0_g1_i1:68-1444(-)